MSDKKDKRARRDEQIRRETRDDIVINLGTLAGEVRAKIDHLGLPVDDDWRKIWVQCAASIAIGIKEGSL